MCNSMWLKLRYLQYSAHKPAKKWDYWSEYTNCRILSLKNNAASQSAPVKNQNILNEHSDLFQGLGCISGEHPIKVDPNIPAVVHPPRKVPVSLKDKIIDELDRIEQTGVIVRQTEPTD